MRKPVFAVLSLGLALAFALLQHWNSPAGGSPLAAPTPTPGASRDQALLEQLAGVTAGEARVSHHSETGRVRFVGSAVDRPIPSPDASLAAAGPEQAARAFLRGYGELFGLADQARELDVIRSAGADGGRAFVRFQQVHKAIPVLGGEIIVQLDAAGNVLSANGEILPDIKTNTAPTLAAAAARQRALDVVAKAYGLGIDAFTATPPALWLYDPSLLGARGPQLTALVWRVEVHPVDLLPIRELVLVDAHLGTVALHFNQVPDARDRRTYDAGNAASLPGTLRRSEGQGATGDSEIDKAHDYAGDTYDFFQTYLGRDGIDNRGMAIISTVRYCPPGGTCPYANAFWNGQQMVYGQGYASADDVVGHELSHGVTDYTSNLFYYMQSGAINEAFSDIWGELIDLANGKGNDASGVRWLLGEDTPVGAIRSLSNPPAYSDPDKMSSPYYYCGEVDNGGVHTNGGVVSKAASLLVDGGSFNGHTVLGLGIAKVAKIFYEVQTHFLTSASDYQDLHDSLVQACTNIIGTNGITAADCQQVQYAVDATEMDRQPTSCATTAAPVCPVGQVPVNAYLDDFENPSSGRWAAAAVIGSNAWYYPQTANPYGYDATYATSGRYNLWGYDQRARADYSIRMTYDVRVPANAYLHFKHAWAFDDYSSKIFDGGVLEYSTNSGVSWSDAGSLFLNQGYNGTIGGSWGNPLGGRSAFTGESNGYTASRANLSALAGQNVRFRFRIGTSDTTDSQRSDALGWFIDDFRIYTCGAAVGPYRVSLSALSREAPLPTPVPVPAGWVTMSSVDFESSFPANWSVFDGNGSSYGEYHWARRGCRAGQGSYSGWAIGGGSNGAALGCGAYYQNNTTSWMIYGPFSLAGASMADLTFKLWLNSEPTYDRICRTASIDGNNFYGTCTSDNTSGWTDRTLDLSNVYTIGNLLVRQNVWVALIFLSDSSVTYSEGAHVDSIVVRKYLPYGAPGIVESAASGAGTAIREDESWQETPTILSIPKN